MTKYSVKILTTLLCVGLFGFYLGAAKPLPRYDQLARFTKVMHYIESQYVKDVSEDQLIQGAIRGMLRTLDPHSAYLTPQMFRDIQDDTSGRFGGIGVVITVRDGILTVVSAIEGTPGSKAGLLPGDRILRIDDKSSLEMSLIEATRLIRGKKGTEVKLNVMRQDFKVPQDFKLVRDTVRIQSIHARNLDSGYGYIRIDSFQENIHKELSKSLATLTKQSEGGLKGLVLDLRNNPGGLLTEAVQISDLFLKEGLIVSTQGREKKAFETHQAKLEGTQPEYPMIVLINRGSASASEIVAGALQDHKRAVILGTPSFGKGSVQTVWDLGEGAGLKLTIAHYYTPSGRSIHHKGIQPDIVVEFPRDQAPPIKDVQLERALGHLKSWTIFKAKEAPEQTAALSQ